MTKQQKTALNMAKFIQNQSLLLLEKLNERSRCEPNFVRNSAMMEHLLIFTVLETGCITGW
jgi:hypothetical protein